MEVAVKFAPINLAPSNALANEDFVLMLMVKHVKI